eukprot:363731-Chlamydomonas_euryale.AAC.5
MPARPTRPSRTTFQHRMAARTTRTARTTFKHRTARTSIDNSAAANGRPYRTPDPAVLDPLGHECSRCTDAAWAMHAPTVCMHAPS